MSGAGQPRGVLTSEGDNARLKIALPPEIFDSVKAITVQPFTEANSKLGTQYETSFYNPSVSAGANADIVIIVGDDPILIKEVSVEFDCTVISSQVFRAPTYTGGTALDVFNFNDEMAVPGTASLLAGATVTDPGTAVGSKIYSLGSEGQGNRRIASVSQRTGVERVLWPGATYLFRITNEDNADSQIAGVATWYQGPLSTQTELVE